jgi:hypothetical protein
VATYDQKVQDTKVIKEGVSICLLGQSSSFACRLLEKRMKPSQESSMLQVLTNLAANVCKYRGKILKEILFLQDKAALHTPEIG